MELFCIFFISEFRGSAGAGGGLTCISQLNCASEQVCLLHVNTICFEKERKKEKKKKESNPNVVPSLVQSRRVYSLVRFNYYAQSMCPNYKYNFLMKK